MADYEEVLRRGLHQPIAGSGRARPDPRSESREADPEEGGLLVSPAFWIAGLFSLLIWLSVAAFFGLL